MQSAVSFDKLLEIISSLPKKNTYYYLVIDDLHIINNEEIINKIPVILKRLPEYIRLCLVSRSQPASDLMETGLFEVITKEDLLFLPDEIEWLGAEYNHEL